MSRQSKHRSDYPCIHLINYQWSRPIESVLILDLSLEFGKVFACSLVLFESKYFIPDLLVLLGTFDLLEGIVDDLHYGVLVIHEFLLKDSLLVSL